MAHRHAVLVLVLVLAWVSANAAHNGDRVFPIRYLSEETLARLDLDDGRIHVAGQFADDVYVNEYDPLIFPNYFFRGP